MIRHAAGVLGVAVLLAGCGGGDDPVEIADPRSAVRDSAAETLASPTSELGLVTSTDGGGTIEADGLVALSRGQFEVDVQATDPDSDYLDGVIGTNGEGFERTFAVNREGLPKSKVLPGIPGPCWFNPHAPVGSFLGTISVEESARLAGAVVESLAGDEIASVTPGDGGDEFLVRLKRSAGQAREDLGGAVRRVWGARELLEDLGGPIQVTVGEDGTLSALEIEVESYRTFETIAPPADVVDEGSIEVRLAPTDRSLEISKPRCQAME